MNSAPDAEVVLRLTPAASGGKECAVRSGYRPTYAIRPDYLTSVNHELLDLFEIAPGSEGRAKVWFITPEVYPNTLWPGREIPVSEGTRVVGLALVMSVFNPVLRANNG
jgi:hypothetical protein